MQAEEERQVVCSNFVPLFENDIHVSLFLYHVLLSFFGLAVHPPPLFSSLSQCSLSLAICSFSSFLISYRAIYLLYFSLHVSLSLSLHYLSICHLFLPLPLSFSSPFPLIAHDALSLSLSHLSPTTSSLSLSLSSLSRRRLNVPKTNQSPPVHISDSVSSFPPPCCRLGDRRLSSFALLPHLFLFVPFSDPLIDAPSRQFFVLRPIHSFFSLLNSFPVALTSTLAWGQVVDRRPAPVTAHLAAHLISYPHHPSCSLAYIRFPTSVSTN